MRLSPSFFQIGRQVLGALFWPALAAVVWGSLTRQPPDLDFAYSYKALHFMVYFCLAGMAAVALPGRRAALAAALSLSALGALVEIAQAFIGRDPSVYDGLANGAGALAGLLLGRLIVAALGRHVHGPGKPVR